MAYDSGLHITWTQEQLRPQWGAFPDMVHISRLLLLIRLTHYNNCPVKQFSGISFCEYLTTIVMTREISCNYRRRTDFPELPEGW